MVVLGDDDSPERKKTKTSASRDAELNTAISDHFKEMNEVAKDLSGIDSIADDFAGEQLFLELMSESESDETDVDYFRTEDLDNDTKDLFNGMGV